VLADQGCRNTVFDAGAQSALPFLGDLAGAGFGCFRVELVDQPPEAVVPLLEGYRAALAGAGGVHERELWAWMQGLPDANGRAQGVGLGSLEVRPERGAAGMKRTAASRR
jgi:putative protease